MIFMKLLEQIWEENLQSSARQKFIECHSSALISTNRFDIIILSHVVEHFLDFSYEFSIIKKLLNGNGVVYIEVPCIIREKPYNFLFSLQNAHAYYFSADTLETTMKLLGFRCIVCHTDGVSIKSIFVLDHNNNYALENELELMPGKQANCYKTIFRFLQANEKLYLSEMQQLSRR